MPENSDSRERRAYRVMWVKVALLLAWGFGMAALVLWWDLFR